MDTENQLNIDEQLTQDNFVDRMFNAKLTAFRAQNPFIPILPFPNTVFALKLIANTAVDVPLPDGTKAIRIRGENAKDYWMNRNGAAKIPTATSVDSFAMDNTGSLLSPNDRYFYVEEIKNLSFIAPADTLVSVECFVQM